MSIATQKLDVKQQWPSYTGTAGDWFAGGGHSHYWTARRFLDALSEFRRSLLGARSGEPLPPTWLLQFRKDFRKMIADNTTAAIDWHLLTGDSALRPLFLWLLSKHADRFRLHRLDEYADDPSPEVRRHVAKALRRLEAWAQLREMALQNRMTPGFSGMLTHRRLAGPSPSGSRISLRSSMTRTLAKFSRRRGCRSGR
jgi:hypothetical protein